MTAGHLGVVFLVMVLVILSGFTAGRRLGQRQGYRQGLSEAPLHLRVQTLHSGVCPICDSDTRHVVQ